VSDCVQTDRQSYHRFEAYSKVGLVLNVGVLSVQCETDLARLRVGMLQVSAAVGNSRCPAGWFVALEYLVVQRLVWPIEGRGAYIGRLLHLAGISWGFLGYNRYGDAFPCMLVIESPIPKLADVIVLGYTTKRRSHRGIVP